MHTEEFIKKHMLLLKKREEEKLNRIKVKEEKKAKSRQKKLEYNRKRYETIKKEAPERYSLYLDYLKEYRKANKAKKENLPLDCVKIYFNGQKRPHYINKLGDLFNSAGRKLKCNRNKNGYIWTKGGSLHRIVWEAFNGEIPEGYEIDHINAKRDDNRLDNLRCVTHKDNCNNPISIENYKKHNKNVDRSYLKKDF